MEIRHDAAGNRFVAELPEGEAELTYQLRGERLNLQHTFVPEAARKRGVGAALVSYAFEFARDNGYGVIATCPFVRARLEADPGLRNVAPVG